jgi:DivIVA domain-containing protein
VTSRAGNHARLTPGRVRAVSFRLAHLGRRGFDEDDVRDFCDQVEGELSLLLEERTALQAELGRLRSWAQAANQRRARVALPGGRAALPSGAAPLGNGPLGNGPAGGGPLGAGPLGAPVSVPAPSPPYDSRVALRPQPLDPNDQALRILAKAQQTAERYVSDAHAYSQEVAHEAQRRRDRILAEASTKATDLLEHAHQVAIRNGATPDPGRGRQATALPAPVPPAAGQAGYGDVAARSAPVPAPGADPAIYGDVAARYPTATRDYRALHSQDPRSVYNSGPGSAHDFNAGSPFDPRPGNDSGSRSAYGSRSADNSGSAHDPRNAYNSGLADKPRTAHDPGPGFDYGPGSDSRTARDFGSVFDPRPAYYSGPAYDAPVTPGSAPASGSASGSAPAPGSALAPSSGSGSGPRPVYNGPVYNSPGYNSPVYGISAYGTPTYDGPAYNTSPARNTHRRADNSSATGYRYSEPGHRDDPRNSGYPRPAPTQLPRSQPGPGADYSTVIGYPGPAADYRAPQVQGPDVPEPAHDGDRYPDGYGRRRSGESPFPF